MRKYVCEVCGYLHTDEIASDKPENCPQCGAPEHKLIEQSHTQSQ